MPGPFTELLAAAGAKQGIGQGNDLAPVDTRPAKRWFDAVGPYSRPDLLSSVSSVGETASVWRTTQ